MGWLIDPFTPPYMQRALLEVALLAAAAGALGAFVVLRRLAFAAHALGVGTFPGVVIAVELGVSAFAIGLVAALVLALVLVLLARRRDLDLPSATGLVLAGALSVGGLLVSSTFRSGEQVDQMLFGSLLGITTADVVRSAVVAALTCVFLGIFGRGWLAVAFDRDGAVALGLRPTRLDIALLATLTLTVVALVDAVGSLLVSAMLLVPAATARLFAPRLLPLVVASVAIALAVCVGGLALAFHVDAPPGATIALLAAAVFLTASVPRSLRVSRRALALGAPLTLLLLAGCGGSSGPSGDGGVPASSAVEAEGALHVVATTPQVAEWARIVGGESVRVTQLLDPNVDAHDFEPTPDAAQAVATADVVLASGAGLDEWADGLVANAGGSTAFVEIAPEADLRPPALQSPGGGVEHEGNAEKGDDDHVDGHAGVDPHFWHDPMLAAKAVETIAGSLGEADPAAAAVFAQRAADYLEQIEALDAELHEAFAAVPAERRKMVTDHDAFGYLAGRYGIEVVGAAIPATSTAAEPSAAEIAELIEAIRAEGVRAIFSEASVDPKLVEQIADEAGATVLPGLYGDSLGPPGSGADTYVEMMRHNAAVLVAGFELG